MICPLPHKDLVIKGLVEKILYVLAKVLPLNKSTVCSINVETFGLDSL